MTKDKLYNQTHLVIAQMGSTAVRTWLEILLRRDPHFHEILLFANVELTTISGKKKISNYGKISAKYNDQKSVKNAGDMIPKKVSVKSWSKPPKLSIKKLLV